MRILLTGATGFIGSAFWRLAVSRGHQVAGLVLPAEADRVAKFGGGNPVWLTGTLDSAPYPEIKAFRPDVCVHTAWITTPGTYLESPINEQFRDASLRFLRQVHALGTNYLVGLGTCIEYKMTGEPLSEERTPIEPITTYARCKNELRLALEADAAARDFDFCWGRVFYPYGPGEHPSRLCSSILQKVLRGEKVGLKTPNSVKDYIYIDDLASAIVHTVEARFRGTINWGTGQGISVRQLAESIAASVGRPDLIINAPAQAVDEFGRVVAENARLRHLGWAQMVDLEQGCALLKATLDIRPGNE